MRISVVLGLIVIAALAGYGLSSLRDGANDQTNLAASDQTTISTQEPLSTEAENETRAAVASAETTSFVTDSPNTATMTSSADSPLPADTTPLAQSVNALTTAMRAGSLEATRRLLKQAKLCARFQDANTSLKFALSVQESAKAPGKNGVFISMPPIGDEVPLTLSGLAKSFAGDVLDNEALCADFDDPQKAIQFEAQWRAALMGDTEGLLEFALNPAIDALRAFEQADRIDRYRARVLGFLTQAMAQHSAQAVANLMHAYDPGWVPSNMRGQSQNQSSMSAFVQSQIMPEPLRQVSGTDALFAYRYARLCQAVCPEFPRAEAEIIARRLRPDLASADRERADAQADQLRDAHFASPDRAPWIANIGEQREVPKPPRGP